MVRIIRGELVYALLLLFAISRKVYCLCGRFDGTISLIGSSGEIVQVDRNIKAARLKHFEKRIGYRGIAPGAGNKNFELAAQARAGVKKSERCA